MKKLVLAAIAAICIAPMFFSCTKKNEACYKVKYTIPEQPAQYDSLGNKVREYVAEFDYEGYKWIDKADVDAWKERMKSLKYENIDIKEESQYKTEADCLSQEHILI